MNRIVLFFVLQFSIINLVYGQNISIETDKKEYKFDEKIRVTFKIDTKIDSVELPEFKGLKIVSGPSSSSSMVAKYGVIERTKTWTYTLRPIKSGKLIVESPIFFINGKEVKGKKKSIKILKSQLTQEELKELRFKTFVEDDIKPKSTYRYILNDEFGYIEIYRNLTWKYHRKLTKEEFELIKTIK